MKLRARRYQLALLFSLLALFGVSISAQRIWEIVPVSFKEKMQSQRRATDSSDSLGKQTAAKRLSDINTSAETAFDPAQTSLVISQSVLSGGGGRSAGGSLALDVTIGQGLAGGSLSGGRFSLSGGFGAASGGSQCTMLSISPATLPNGQLGQPYNQQLTQAGGAGAIAWTISTGVLPNGITLNAGTGLLSGTPTASGNFPFTVKATDANGCLGTQAYTLVIAACPVITITPGSLPNATTGVAYNQTLMANGGTPPYTFSLNAGSTAPPGLTLLVTGTLVGTPTTANIFPFTVKVTDANGCIGTQQFALTVNQASFAVSGRVVDLAGNGISAVTMTFSTILGVAQGPVQTDTNGNWTKSGFVADCKFVLYTVKPSKAGYFFIPDSLEFCAASATLNFTGAPVVTTVSAASFKGEELAQESIVAAFGQELATKVEIANTTPLPTTLAGTTVKIKDSAGTERNAPLFFVAPSQINYQIPPGTAVGAASLTVTSGDNKVSLGAINVSRVAPALFTANASGQGVPAARILRVRNGVQIFEAVSAAPIDLGPETDVVYLLLFGSGVRNSPKAEDYSVDFGGVVKMLSAANFEGGFAVPGFVGLDQINVLLPRSLVGKGGLNLTLTVEGKPANPVQLNIK